MAITNFEVYATRLRDERLDIKLKQTIAHELCESLECFQIQDYSRLVTVLWPVIRDLLLKTPPVFISSAPEQKLRATLLEIIQRIPQTDVFRPVVLEVVTTLQSLIKIENEDNAVVCLKIIYELHRVFRQVLESFALPFLELATEIYRNADQMLKTIESMDTPASLATPNVNLMSPSAMSPGPESSEQTSKSLIRATASFKVMTEIPIIVVSIMQANRRHADPFVSDILPLILHVLDFSSKGYTISSSGGGGSGSGSGGQQDTSSTTSNWRSCHSDLIMAQSKTLSFLAFFARGFTILLHPYHERIASLTLQLLCSCPAEATATRKEMLIATRHIVSTEIRKAFVSIADKFLDMQVLVGSGLASRCILKPFAFSMLADLMHHIRQELSPNQLTRMVEFYSGCMYDQSLSSGVHTMCAKLLHNITECIMNIPDKRHGRVLLLSILRTYVSSFSVIGNHAETAIADIKSDYVFAEEKIYGSGELIRTNTFEQGDKIKELRFLLRSLVTGCKNVIYALRKCDSVYALGMGPRTNPSFRQASVADNSEAQAAPNSISSSIVTNQETEIAGFEIELLKSLFQEGLRACRIHDVDRIRAEHTAKTAAGKGGETQSPSTPVASSTPSLSREAQIKLVDREGKEQIENFANLFVSLDSAVFHELFTSQFDYAFNFMVEHYATISIVQVFVATETTSPAFVSIMLRYLCNRLDILGSDNEALTGTMLHLFKTAFLALAFFAEANEPVLQPYVQTIINSALTTSKNAKKPGNYFLLLRTLFRSIGGGRYESLYKEVFPALQNLLETLNNALSIAKRTSPIQELFAEICLTVPVRLSVLLPYLSLLMKPLVYALESGPDLVSQGLRTLELCIDNLTREFLDPILTPVIDDIMASLWLHLRLPVNGTSSTQALVAARILGKLGGRNRHMLLTHSPDAATNSSEDQSPDSHIDVPMAVEGLSGLVTMPLTDAVSFAIKILEGRVATKQQDLARQDAISFVLACARYTLVLPFICESGMLAKDEVQTEDTLEAGRQLITLTSNPLAWKRLVSVSSPTAQGIQVLERTLAACPSISGTYKLGSDALKAGDCDGLSESIRPASIDLVSLDDLYVASNSPCEQSQTMPINYQGLIGIFKALSLACSYSNVAQRLMKSIISESARQHIIQCVGYMTSGDASSFPSSGGLDGGSVKPAALANAIPEIISQSLASHSETLRSTGCLLLRHFYDSLLSILSEKPRLVGQLPAMRNIVSDLCVACYDPNFETKRNGCSGIAFIVRELNPDRSWLAENLLELSKALLFTLKDTHPNVTQHSEPANARTTMLEIIRQVFPESIFAASPSDTEDGKMDVDVDVEMSDALPENEGVADGESVCAVDDSQGNSASADQIEKDDDISKGIEDIAAAITNISNDEKDMMDEVDKQEGDSGTSEDLVTKGENNDEKEEDIKSSDDHNSDGNGNDSQQQQPTAEDDNKPESSTDNDASKAAAAVAAANSRATELAAQAFQKLSANLSSDNSRLLKVFLALITKELANPSNEVRETVKACLDILVKVTRCSVTTLLLPSRDRLLVPIFGKPLRALPHNMQIGNIDAITYCLALDPPFLVINDELLRLLSEALALADAEDQALVNHPAQVRSNTTSLTHLRHVCIRMLTAAMVRPEFSDSKNAPTRARIISVFFKSLYHSSSEVVEAANDGLKQVLLQQQKLPRDLLQTGLRPILLNLSDYKRLTVASLEGLARLLQLLTNYFKVEVGRKLLDHMQQWANPQLLQLASERSIEDMQEIKILVAILEVFHLLPPSANVLLDDLVSSVVNLEVHLCRRESSPFRKPLFKFLNRYPEKSIVYFVERIESAHYARIFTHAIKSNECSPLREALVAKTSMLVDILRSFSSVSLIGESTQAKTKSEEQASGMTVKDNPSSSEQQATSDMVTTTADQPAASDTNSKELVYKRLTVAASVVALICANMKHMPLWFQDHNELLQGLLDAWSVANDLELTPVHTAYLAKPVLLESVVHSLLLANRGMSCPASILFKLLEIAGCSSHAIETSFVFQFVWNDLVVKWPISRRREILLAFLPRLTNSDNTSSTGSGGGGGALEEANSIILRYLINPMIATTFNLPAHVLLDKSSDTTIEALSSLNQRGMELLRGKAISLIHQRVWVTHMSSGTQLLTATKASIRLELIQLSSILLRHAANVVSDQRKEIIKFGWLYIRNEDIMIKNASYVLVSQFIAAFDTPPKIILQVYSSLLKAHQVETRFLVRQALDILLPVLPVRLGTGANPPSSLHHSALSHGANSTEQTHGGVSASNGSSAGLPAWVLLAKRVLIDHASSLMHTTHVYQLIAGHSSIFFPYRMQFVPNLVGSLQKMCLTHSATSETRILALDIMEMLLKWKDLTETTAANDDGGSGLDEAQDSVGDNDGSTEKGLQGAGISGNASSMTNGNTDGNNQPTHPPASTSSSKLMNETRRETVVGLLLRMLCLIYEFAFKSNLGPRALDLLSRYLDSTTWSPMHLRLTFFERSIQNIEAQGMNQQLVLHFLTVLSTVTAQMQPVWFEEYYGILVSMVGKCIVVDNGQVQKIVSTMLRQLYKQAAESERLSNSPVVAELKSQTENLIGKNLQDNVNIYGTLLILDAIGEFYTNEQFNAYTPLLMKYVQKYTKEHNSTVAGSSLNGYPLSSSNNGPPSILSSGSSSTSMSTLATGDNSGTGGTGLSRAATTTSTLVLTLAEEHRDIPLSLEKLIKGETPLDVLLMLLLLLRNNISRLGDQRRSFLTYVIQLIERSSDPALLHVILSFVRDWVIDPQDAFPTIKEKAMLMSSMMSFVNGSVSASDNVSRANVRSMAAASLSTNGGSNSSIHSPGLGSTKTSHSSNDPFALLERKYLTLVLEVYNDPRFTRSEMTMRLEQAFLSGMQSEDCEMRGKFLETFDANMPPSLPVRLNYLLETQNWESVSSTFWLQQCLPLLLASTHQKATLQSFVRNPCKKEAVRGVSNDSYYHIENQVSSMDVDTTVATDAISPATSQGSPSFDKGNDDMDVDDIASGGNIKEQTGDSAKQQQKKNSSVRSSMFIPQHTFQSDILSQNVLVGEVVGPLARMVLFDTQFAYRMWVTIFPLLWKSFGHKDRHDLTSGLIRLLAKPYHQSQISIRPNVVQAILDGFCGCSPAPKLPPQLLRYLGQTYGAWHSALMLLEQKILSRSEMESVIFDRAMGVELGAFDALTELYTSLSSSHYFFGAWKRHCQYKESHVALAYEQLGDWSNAQAAYERAQSKARDGILPFSESEYCLWESRWVDTTKKLQNWDMLLDLGVNESLPEIELEAGWRQWDWNEKLGRVRQLTKAASAEYAETPRIKFYETFLCLARGGNERSKAADFQRMCKEGIRAALKRWNELPAVGTTAHLDILHMFQLMVELGDASNIYNSLAATKADNLEAKSSDLKSVLQTWRERLPSDNDPINIWSDLVAWRQHVFKAINDVYVPFISQGSSGEGIRNKANNKGADNKGGRRGGAADGSGGDGSNSNNSVLTSYAYRGYHEMAWIINRFAQVARKHELVDVCINSLTRIYTLPNIEIQEAFLKLREQAKCYYGRAQELQSGLDVISNTNLVYFTNSQKAEFYTLKGQFLEKLGKTDEANHAFATGIQLDLASPKAWAEWGRYNDELFCSSMSDITWAVNAINCYMQAAGLSKRAHARRYLARTLWLLSQDDEDGKVCAAFDAYKSEMPTWYWIAFVPQLLAGLDSTFGRQAQQILHRIAKQYPQSLYYALRTAREERIVAQRQQQAMTATVPTAADAAADELMAKLKTAHPLLALSMETMIDQITHRLKPCPEEDIYRLVHALLTDGLQQLHTRLSQEQTDFSLLDAIVSNTCRVSLGLPSGAVKTRFEADFGAVRDMDLCEYITKLYQWQQMLRHAIRRRPTKLALSHSTQFLAEFEQQKFEDVEVPGQYMRLSDSNDDFVRIERFMPNLEVQLRSGNVARRLAIRGGDGDVSHFAVQHFASRHSRQEERWAMLLRNLDVAGEHDRDSWEQRRLALHLTEIVPLAPHIRLVRELQSSFTLQDVYDSYCVKRGMPEIAPALCCVARSRHCGGGGGGGGGGGMSSATEGTANDGDMISDGDGGDDDSHSRALVTFEYICRNLVPSSLLTDDAQTRAASPMAYWLYRESFTFQLALSCALTYIIAASHRTPAKMSMLRSSGAIPMGDLVPSYASPGIMYSNEPVPFRLTPTIQSFVTELGLEGVVPLAIHKVALRLTDQEYLLRDFLDLYVRDELVSLPAASAMISSNPQALSEMCDRNVKLISARASQLVGTLPLDEVKKTGQSPVQPLIRLMAQAVAPENLAKMDFAWMPWL